MGPKVGPKLKKKKIFFDVTVSLKIRIWQNFWKHSVPLFKHYLWCKFQQDRIIFGGVRAPKPPKMAQFMAAPLPRKLLKIYNLRITNAMAMKLGTIVYFHETFRLTKNLGVS